MNYSSQKPYFIYMQPERNIGTRNSRWTFKNETFGLEQKTQTRIIINYCLSPRKD